MKYVYQEKPHSWDPQFDAVSCICWLDDRILCLLRNSEKREGHKWGFPAGKLEGNESKEAAVRREFKEELSLRLPNIQFMQLFFVRYTELDFTFSVFQSNFQTTPDIEINKKENKDFGWKTVEEFLSEEVVNGNKEIVRILYPQLGIP